MPPPPLRDCAILVAEDEYFLAEDLRSELVDAGAIIVGPVASLAAGFAASEGAGRIDGALLDVDLNGEAVFPLADALEERQVPFLFTTGYDATAIPGRFDHVVRCEKPFDVDGVIRALSRAIFFE